MSEPKCQIFDYYRIDSGNKIPVVGEVEYAVTTHSGQGFGFAKSGKHFLTCSDVSHEAVGCEVRKNNDSNQPFTPSKWILAKNGDIKIEAPNGTIHLEARNVRIKATGAETDDTQDGNVDIQASNEIVLDSSDKVKISAVSLRMTSSFEMTIDSSFMTITACFSGGGSSVDAALGILDIPSQFITDVTNLKLF
jgi:hypothetical protein